MPGQELLNGINPSLAGYGSVALIGVTALIVFKIARKIVALGYFVLYFFIGFGIVYSASAYATKSFQVPLWTPIVGGLAFSAVASAIRAKLMRIVSALMMVALFSLAGKYWSQYAHKDAQASDSDKALAMGALSKAKKEWDDLAPLLNHGSNGKIKAGPISPEDLKKLGVQADLEKVTRTPAWHTLLTGLYNEEKQELELWTSGGTLEQAKKSLTLKPKK